MEKKTSKYGLQKVPEAWKASVYHLRNWKIHPLGASDCIYFRIPEQDYISLLSSCYLWFIQ